MDFINELQRFLNRQGSVRVKADGGLLWMKEKETRIELIEIIPERLPGQNRLPVARQEERIGRLENQIMIRLGKKTERLTLMLFRGMP